MSPIFGPYAVQPPTVNIKVCESGECGWLNRELCQ